ncbi:hypothetical protein THIOM_002828 [Candidatus Thiomargarita nelsonii]|uniref:Uncharacterized protein n=1 Tax=Candidatus Thiomargarita nelsonii TaxID=1003181 RepID=A0A176S009_9GAMM|nr:hypothetical protein THIOM_002828 [Candidatus Thiomargarita nelsonii]
MRSVVVFLWRLGGVVGCGSCLIKRWLKTLVVNLASQWFKLFHSKLRGRETKFF